MPRSACPSWRWITFSGTPSRAISTAWACRSWWGAKRRRTPAWRGETAKLRSGGGHRPGPARRRPAEDAKQRPDRLLTPVLEPGPKLLPAPLVHPHLAPPAALAAADQHRPAGGLQISLPKRERLRDPKPGAPKDDHKSAEAKPRRAIAGPAHDRDDLLDPRRVGRVSPALVSRRTTGAVSRQGGRRATAARGVKRCDCAHGSLLSRLRQRP